MVVTEQDLEFSWKFDYWVVDWKVKLQSWKKVWEKKMTSSAVNLVMTVIGFTVSIIFIVFVCTRLICARIQYLTRRRSSAYTSRSDLSIVSSWIYRFSINIVEIFSDLSHIYMFRVENTGSVDPILHRVGAARLREGKRIDFTYIR